MPGALVRAGHARGVLIVFAHGAGAGHRSPFMRRYAALLAERGFDVLTFDFPYMAAGRKLADKAPVLEAAFHAAVAAGLAATGAREVIVAGKSMGGRMATHLAAAPDAWRAPAPLTAAVAFGYPLRPPGPRGGDRVSHLRRLAVPTLIVQGTRDTFGGPDAVAADVGPVPHLTVLPVETGDHSLKVRASLGRAQEDVESDIAGRVAAWFDGL
jgi:predicted alpha/beta-hydrolase family hydrolase